MMIISKPKLSTLFSLGAFLVLAYGLATYLFIQVARGMATSWMVIGLGVSAGVAVAVTIKTITGYQQLFVSKNKIEVMRIFGLGKRTRYFKDLTFWKETSVKTFSGQFKELDICFQDNKHVKLTLQENSNYDKVHNFMLRSYKRKMQ